MTTHARVSVCVYLGAAALRCRQSSESDPSVHEHERTILTLGPEGGTGHPDHRLVGDVVTEIVQASATDIPLYYPGLPLEQMTDAPPARPTVRLTGERYLNVRVPFTPRDFDAAVQSYICHWSQYTEEQARANMRYVQHGFRDAVRLRAWNGGPPRLDLFATPASQR